MSTRSLTALLALVAVLVGSLTWIATSERESERTKVAASAPRAAAPVESDDVPADDGVLQALLVPESASTTDVPAELPIAAPVLVLDESARNAVRTAYDLELEAARWIEGRVLFPPGTPADERAFVVAKGMGFQHGPPHRVPVAADGTFRVAFAPKTSVGRLELEALYLRLERSERVTLDEAPERVDLVPVLGGLLRGRLVPPEADAEVAKVLDGKKLTLELKESAGAEVDPGARFRGTEIGADLAFELGGLPAGAYRLEFASSPFVPVRIDDIVVELGRVRTLEVLLGRGVTLAGRALDTAGRPVPGASVMAFFSSAAGAGMLANGTVLSDENGAFVVSGLAPGRIELRAGQLGFENTTVELGELADGEVRDGIELVLDRGLSIAGTVLWPDGTRAAGALVRAVAEDGFDPGGLFGSSWKTDADGRFEIGGLDTGKFLLEASADLPPTVEVKDPLAPPERERKQESLRSSVPGIAAGTQDLVLTLNAGALVCGRVIDEHGRPVSEFTLQARRASAWTRRPELTGSFDDPDGRFELAGFQPGAWKLEARTSKGPASSPLEIDVPGPLDALELVVRAGGSLAGEAYDADGRALAAREVEIQNAAANHFETLVTDDAGRFFAEFVPPGDCWVRLRARDPDVRAVLDPGQDAGPLERTVTVHIVAHETAHVILTLPEVEPVRVSGRVMAGDQPAANASVSFFDCGENGGQTRCATDEHGRYSIVLGRPGDYFVNLHSEDGLSLSDRVQVPPATAFELDLSFPVGWISGRVRNVAREPLAGIQVTAHGETGYSLGSGTARTNEQGSYTLLVPAGTFLVKAGGQQRWSLDPEGVRFGESRVEGIVVEPDARVDDVDLVLEAGGTVEGVVRWEDGTFAEGVPVNVFDASGARIAFGLSAAGGRFRVEGITPGPSSLEALNQQPQAVARADVEVSVSETRDVELVLRGGRFIVVETLDADGARVAAEVEVEDSRGRRLPTTRIGGTIGHTSLGLLEWGRYTVRARHGGRELQEIVELSGEGPPIPLTVEMVFR